LKKWDLPKGWEWKKLGEMASISDRNHTTPSYKNSGYPLVSPTMFTEYGIGLEKAKFVDKSELLDFKKKCAPSKGDLLYSRIGSIGKARIIDFDNDFVALHSIAVIKPKKMIVDNRFLYYFLNSVYGTRQANAGIRSISVPDLGLEKIENFSIPTPPLETQHKIVAILDKAEEIKRLRAEASAQTQKLIQSVFLDMFGDPEANPNRWSLNKISNLVIMDKDVVKSTDMSGITNYVGLVNIVSNTGELIKDNTQSDEIIKSNKFKFTNNHILYGKLRPYLNKVALPDYDGICSTDILTFRALDGVATREFIGWLFRTPYFVNFATNKSQGANLPRISPSQIMNFECPHPPYKLQIKFSNFVKTVETRNKFLNLANNEIDSIYRYLNSEIFKGELIA